MIRLLQGLELFQSLSTDDLKTIAANSAWRRLGCGETVFTKGQKAGRLYAVHQGEVLITKRGDQDRDINLATFVDGDGFGELTLFDHEAQTTARCEDDTTLLIFPDQTGSATAESFFARHPQIAAVVLHNLLALVAGRIRSTNRLIAEKSPWVQELKRQVMLDKLTGLYNNSFLEEEFTRLLGAKTDKISLLMMKPDNFKTVNDDYGHNAGDRVLQLMAEELKKQLDQGSIAVRYQGDVYAVILRGLGLKQAKHMAEIVRRGMYEIDLDEVTGDREKPEGGLR
ncbi:MAG TPA: GGDEF domain-containing protein, partial [bacterium]|nr:GGDEF domain-containing protein [bacterium]